MESWRLIHGVVESRRVLEIACVGIRPTISAASVPAVPSTEAPRTSGASRVPMLVHVPTGVLVGLALTVCERIRSTTLLHRVAPRATSEIYHRGTSLIRNRPP